MPKFRIQNFSNCPKKTPKGCATSQSTLKNEAYFKLNDRNDENDPCSAKRVNETIFEMEEISKRISQVRNLWENLRQKIVIENCNTLISIADHTYLNGEDLPAGFDPLHYLLLNPDVLIAGADPIQHYLEFGEKENRKYKL